MCAQNQPLLLSALFPHRASSSKLLHGGSSNPTSVLQDHLFLLRARSPHPREVLSSRPFHSRGGPHKKGLSPFLGFHSTLRHHGLYTQARQIMTGVLLKHVALLTCLFVAGSPPLPGMLTRGVYAYNLTLTMPFINKLHTLPPQHHM